MGWKDTTERPTESNTDLHSGKVRGSMESEPVSSTMPQSEVVVNTTQIGSETYQSRKCQSFASTLDIMPIKPISFSFPYQDLLSHLEIGTFADSCQSFGSITLFQKGPSLQGPTFLIDVW